MDEIDAQLFSRRFSDLKPGLRFETRGRTITEADIVNFAGFSGDWNPHHVDARFAAGTRFGQRIAHGMGVLSIAIGLMPFEIEVVRALLGLSHVRFRRPVVLGATIRVVVTVDDLRERDADVGEVSLAFDIVGEDELRVCTGSVELLWVR
jgi:3-hydroxybutyryl-CoA dehydratase